MKKAIFVDRDGTVIFEPPVTEQVDSLEQLEFMPWAISSLAKLGALDYEVVLASNQDGLGTEAYPQEHFDIVHAKMLKTLEGEGFMFDDQLIDPSLASENSPRRKPGTGMFGKYLSGEYDLSQSYVVGDRRTDLQLARNLGCKGILYSPDAAQADGFDDCCVLVTDDWRKIAEFIRRGCRQALVERTTSETSIRVAVDLDGGALMQGAPAGISTGLNFLDHMLDQIAHHGGVSLAVAAEGDLQVDEHHTMEDVAIALGEALAKALGDKRGIGRYGFVLPMDESEAMVLMDLGGRIDFSWKVEFTREYVGDVPTEMFKHFFHSLACAMKCNLHIEAHGENNHHIAEGIFKAFARALRSAVRQDPMDNSLPSSKGAL